MQIKTKKRKIVEETDDSIDDNTKEENEKLNTDNDNFETESDDTKYKKKIFKETCIEKINDNNIENKNISLEQCSEKQETITKTPNSNIVDNLHEKKSETIPTSLADSIVLDNMFNSDDDTMFLPLIDNKKK